MSEDPAYLDASRTAAALGVTLPTLYAYVSRGLLASEAVPGERRARRYRRDDVERLQARQELRRHPETAAPRALAWGEPVLDSALTLIDGRRLYYRGRDAVELSRRLTVEQVAALLWTGDEAAAEDLFPFAARAAAPRSPRGGASMRRLPIPGDRAFRRLSAVERLQAWLPRVAAADDAAWDLRPEAVARCGARILDTATAVVAGRPLQSGGVVATLAAGWRPRGRGARAALSAALALCADHELNVSTFAARCAASAEATPWDAVSAGLAALKGRRHGGEAFRLEALLRDAAGTSGGPKGAERKGAARRSGASRGAAASDAAAADGAAAAVSAWLRRGERLPGFGHRLYPAGDPRATELLALAGRAAPASAALRRVQALQAAVRALTGELPNLDFGLAALAASLRLPPGAPQALFALGRTVGWIAHAIEEYGRGALIRPRARYVGPPPQEGAAASAPISSARRRQAESKGRAGGAVPQE